MRIKGYEIMEDGRIFSNLNWRGYGKRELSHRLNFDGYPSVRLVIKGKRKRMTVHGLVGKTHVSGFKKGYQIRHLDGNKLNCHYSNLKWGTAKENALDREIHGKTSRGNRHSEFIKSGLNKKKSK